MISFDSTNNDKIAVSKILGDVDARQLRQSFNTRFRRLRALGRRGVRSRDCRARHRARGAAGKARE